MTDRSKDWVSVEYCTDGDDEDDDDDEYTTDIRTHGRGSTGYA